MGSLGEGVGLSLQCESERESHKWDDKITLVLNKNVRKSHKWDRLKIRIPLKHGLLWNVNPTQAYQLQSRSRWGKLGEKRNPGIDRKWNIPSQSKPTRMLANMKITIQTAQGNDFVFIPTDEEAHMVLLYATQGMRALDNPELIPLCEAYGVRLANKWLASAGLPPVEEGMEAINSLCERERRVDIS